MSIFDYYNGRFQFDRESSRPLLGGPESFVFCCFCFVSPKKKREKEKKRKRREEKMSFTAFEDDQIHWEIGQEFDDGSTILMVERMAG